MWYFEAWDNISSSFANQKYLQSLAINIFISPQSCTLTWPTAISFYLWAPPQVVCGRRVRTAVQDELLLLSFQIKFGSLLQKLSAKHHLFTGNNLTLSSVSQRRQFFSFPNDILSLLCLESLFPGSLPVFPPWAGYILLLCVSTTPWARLYHSTGTAPQYCSVCEPSAGTGAPLELTHSMAGTGSLLISCKHL